MTYIGLEFFDGTKSVTREERVLGMETLKDGGYLVTYENEGTTKAENFRIFDSFLVAGTWLRL